MFSRAVVSHIFWVNFVRLYTSQDVEPQATAKLCVHCFTNFVKIIIGHEWLKTRRGHKMLSFFDYAEHCRLCSIQFSGLGCWNIFFNVEKITRTQEILPCFSGQMITNSPNIVVIVRESPPQNAWNIPGLGSHLPRCLLLEILPNIELDGLPFLP